MERYYKPGDEPVPRYVLVNKLGKGAFGEVWKASTRSGVEVALKIISLENKSGLKEFRAIRTVKNIHQPNLVPIIDIWLRDAAGNIVDEGGEADSVIVKEKAAELIIAMGLCEKSLFDRLKEYQKQGKPGIAPEELFRYMEDAARAIDYLNIPQTGSERAAIQHCDIKPGNIMIVGGAAQVCDFGLARVLGSDARATRSGDHMSVPYTSPELFWDASKPSQWSDQYSLAVSYVELRTGSLPFEHTTPAGMMFAHTQGKLDLSKLSPLEQAVIRRATSVEAVKRYPTTVEMVQELRRAYERSSKPTTQGPWLDDSLRKGAEIVPGYRLVRRIGQGGYGTVWEARAPGGRPVALKVICNLEAGTGRQEFKALELIKSLNHLHLLELHAYWLLDIDGNVIPDDVWNEPNAPEANTLVIATKLAQMNLQQRLHECQQSGSAGIPSEELINYIRQSALAIDYLNECQHPLDSNVVSIQHRDIKPENILLVSAGTVQVGDFGLARVLEGTSSAIRRESRAFTPPYAAPELYTDQVTRWTDQYALALTYYKLRTGVLPFSEQMGRTEIMMTHVEGKLDLGRLPETEKQVIARATALKSENRYPTCLAMVDALDRALKADFADAPAEPFLRPRADRHQYKTAVYTPIQGVEIPNPTFGQEFATHAELNPRTDDVLVYTQPVGEPDPSAVVTPPPRQHPTEASNVTTPRPAAAIPTKKAWVQPAPRRSARPLRTLFAVLFVGVVGAGVFMIVMNRKQPVGPALETNQVAVATAPDVPPAVRPTMPVPPTQPTRPTTPATMPRPLTVAERIDAKVKDGERALNADEYPAALEALVSAKTLAQDNGRFELWNRIIFDIIRTQARQAQAKKGDWTLVPQSVRDLRDEELLPADQAYKDFFVRLAESNATPPKAVAEADLDLLDRLKRQTLETRFDQWERGQHQWLESQIIDDLFKQIDRELRAGIDDFAKLDAALALMTRLTNYDKRYESRVADKQSVALTNLRKKAESFKQTFDAEKPFDAPYVDAKKAEAAHRLLLKVKSLVEQGGKRLTPEMGAELAMATWYAAPDRAAVRQEVIDRLGHFEKPSDTRGVPYLLVEAEALSRGSDARGLATACRDYMTVHDRIKDTLNIPVDVRYEKSLKPALRTGEMAVRQLDDIDTKSLLAKCYLAKGDLIREFPKEVEAPGTAEKVIAAYDRAFQLNKDPRELADRSRALRFMISRADMSKEEQRRCLNRAVDYANDAVNTGDEVTADLALNAKGRALELIAERFTETGKYLEAIQAFTNAIAKNPNMAVYYLDRGRCLHKRAYAENKWEYLDTAAKDLDEAIAKPSDSGLKEEERVEALYWLGTAMAYRPKPDLAAAEKYLREASQLAEAHKSYGGLYVYGLWSDGRWAIIAVERADALAAKKDKDAGAYLDKAIAAAKKFATAIFTNADQAVYQSWGADVLVRVAKHLLEVKQDPQAALALYRIAVPDEKVAEASATVARLLNARNSVFVHKQHKEKVKAQRPAKLERDAEVAVELSKGLDDQERLTAHLTAALCYEEAKDNKKAVSHLTDAKKLAKSEPQKQEIQKLIDTLNKAG